MNSVKMYYHRDELRRPVVTVAIYKSSDGTIYRGVSICSAEDNPCKKEGRGYALDRLLDMIWYKKGLSSEKIVSRAAEVMKSTGADFSHYDSINPVLTEFEERLLSGGEYANG